MTRIGRTIWVLFAVIAAGAALYCGNHRDAFGATFFGGLALAALAIAAD